MVSESEMVNLPLVVQRKGFTDLERFECLSRLSFKIYPSPWEGAEGTLDVEMPPQQALLLP